MKGIDSARVEAAIRAAEARTSGELRVAVARFFLGHDVRRAAEKTFHRLGIHRTKRRNGVLIFVAPLGRRCAVIADEGAHGAVDPTFWGDVVDRLLDRFRAGDLTGGPRGRHPGDCGAPVRPVPVRARRRQRAAGHRRPLRLPIEQP